MDIMLNRIIELIGNKRGASKELANVIGIPANLITDWKAGRNKSYPKYAPAIAEYYGVSLDWLSGLTDEKVQTKKPATISGDELDNEIIRLISQLRGDRRKTAIDYLRFLVQEQENEATE
jgi:transcriptional regulator with XRE-family HTH domain